MNPPFPDPVTNGLNSWPPFVLNHAAAELRREFPQMHADRLVEAVNFAAQTMQPPVGSVALLQRARELLR